MRTVPLGEIITPAANCRAEGSEYPILSMTMHGGLIDQASKFKKRIASEDVSAYKVVRRGQLVVGFPIDEGVLDIQNIYDFGIVSPAYGIWDVPNSSEVCGDYLKRFLRSPRAMSYYKAKLRGSTARRRSLPREVFLALAVPLPPLDQQRRIAAILDRADSLRVKTRRVLERIDRLPGSIFHETFGDPEGNQHGWQRVRLGDVVAGISSGESPVCENRPAIPGEWGVLKLGAVSYGRFNPRENKAFLGDLASVRKVEVQPGDFLFSRKNTKELVGATVVVGNDVPRGLLLPDLIFRLDLVKSEIVPDYLHGLLRHSRKRPQVVALASGSASSMSNISQARLRELTIELPPIERQREYAQRVRRVDCLRSTYKAELAGIDRLCFSLQSRAFSGQL